MQQAMVVTQMEDFVDPASIPEELLCSICTGVFIDAQAGPCGHRFCGFCLEQWLKRSACCPLCRGDLQQPDLTPDCALQAECDALHVHCPWRCGWKGRRDERATHTTVCSVGYFIDITVPIEGPLGVCFEIMDDLMLVGALHEESAMRRHNGAHENQQERQIRVNDQVVQVDGIRGDPALIAYLVKRPNRKSVTFRHPEELAINVARNGKKLGIDLSWSQPNGILTVLGVDGGALEEYNSSAGSPSKRLLRHDRIIEVNGVACVGRPDSVVPMLMESEEFTIRFHRQRFNSICSL